MKRTYFTVLFLIGLLLCTGLFGLIYLRQANQAPQSLVLAMSEDITGFDRAYPPADIQFPRDMGPHPGYQTEWWYYTGNLDTQEGRHFGFQLTIFRRALIPIPLANPRASDLATTQVYMGHFAITDVEANQHRAYERFARGAGDFAGAQAVPYRVWLEDWQINQTGAKQYQLSASQGADAIELSLIDQKGPVLQGINGYSQKGPDPGNASYYFSQTHLSTSGEITFGGQTYEVQGLSWHDHEYSTSALSADQVGWDWFAFQLDDGSELKLFDLRKADGSVDEFSAGSFIDLDGKITHLSNHDFEINPTNTWKSPTSGAVYPSGWKIRVPRLQIELEVTPYIKNQELIVSYTYWEGAVQIRGSVSSQPVSGNGFAELTGYAGSIAGEF